MKMCLNKNHICYILVVSEKAIMWISCLNAVKADNLTILLIRE